MQDAGIVRNRLKIEGLGVKRARAILLPKRSLDRSIAFIWQFYPRRENSA